MSLLYEPLILGGVGDDCLTLKNRVILAPLTRGRAGKEKITGNPWNIDYYTQRSGAGLIISEATVISKQGDGWFGAPGLYTDAQVDGWKKLIDAIHAKEGKIFIQLWHMGRVTHSALQGLHPVSASAIRVTTGSAHGPDHVNFPYETPRALELTEIPSVIEEYKKAAENAKIAGADGVEIHAANGYLLDQFLQSVSNIRTDIYGGSFENRFRLLREVLEAVLTVFPANRIGIRFAPNGSYNDMGSADNFEAFTYFIGQLEKYKLGYVHIMDGLAFGYHQKAKVFRLNDARKVYSGTIIGNCGYTKEKAEGAVESGVVDAIAFGRPFISNPDLVERFKNNWPLEELADPKGWYGFPEENPGLGYSDFPFYEKK